MYSATFIFDKKQFDPEFHALDAEIAEAARRSTGGLTTTPTDVRSAAVRDRPSSSIAGWRPSACAGLAKIKVWA